MKKLKTVLLLAVLLVAFLYIAPIVLWKVYWIIGLLIRLVFVLCVFMVLWWGLFGGSDDQEK